MNREADGDAKPKFTRQGVKLEDLLLLDCVGEAEFDRIKNAEREAAKVLPDGVRLMAEEYRKWEAEQMSMSKICGSCELFTDEDLNGFGWCQFHDGQERCDGTCRQWNPRVPGSEGR